MGHKNCPMQWKLFQSKMYMKHFKCIYSLLEQDKFACNTNLMLLMPGPYSQYVFKYLHKGTQKKGSQTYDKVFTIIEKNQA